MCGPLIPHSIIIKQTSGSFKTEIEIDFPGAVVNAEIANWDEKAKHVPAKNGVIHFSRVITATGFTEVKVREKAKK